MRAMVYAVINQKGGVGKTTLAMNLAAGFARRGSAVVLDADPQASATLWARVSGRFPVSVLAVSEDAQSDLKQLSECHDCVVVDCPPSIAANGVITAVESADVLLIPVLPSPMDLWASTHIEDLVGDARLRNPGLKVFMVINQLEPRNAMSRAMETTLQEYSVPSLLHGLSRRAAYRTAVLEGCSVYELGPRGRIAAGEVEAIIEEVRRS
ncbi:MAG: ParA family partition ATPase [Sulfuricaulis sp.]